MQVGIASQDIPRPVICLGHDAVDLFVDLPRDLLAVVTLLPDLAAQEDQFMALAEDHRPQLVAHAVLRDHGPRDLRYLVQVIHRAVGHIAEDHLFGHAAGQHRAQVMLELRPADQDAVVFGQRHRVTERHAPADDADFVNRVGLGQHPPHQRMAGLVIGDDLLFLRGDDARAALRSGDDLLDGLLQFGHADGALVAPRGQDRAFVDQVLQVRTDEARRPARNRLQVHPRL